MMNKSFLKEKNTMKKKKMTKKRMTLYIEVAQRIIHKRKNCYFDK